MFFGCLRRRCVCGSVRLRRSSRRNRRENLLRLIIRPWRCEDCDRRCFKASWLRPPAPGNVKSGLIDRLLSYTARLFDRGTGTSDLD